LNKYTNINIRITEEKKEEILQQCKKLSHTLNLKIYISTFMMWLYDNWKSGEEKKKKEE